MSSEMVASISIEAIPSYRSCTLKDIEFGKLQARDMLQHLWTGPIANSSVDFVQGSRLVEMRAVGVTKGAAIERILGEIVHSKAICTPIDYVLCLGHFLGKDEDVYTFFYPDATKLVHEKWLSSKLPSNGSNSKSQVKNQQNTPNSN